MNIKIGFIGVVSAALLLTGCAGNTETESGSSEVSSPEISDESSSVSLSSTTSTSTAANTSSSSSTSSSMSEPVKDIKLSDYVSDFDDVEPVGYGLYKLDFNLCDDSVTEKAIEAYKNSEFYSEALQTAYDLFQVENGELVPADDMWRTDEKRQSGFVEAWGNMLSVNEENEIAFETLAYYGFTAKLDGIHDESIVVLNSFCPARFREYSGTTVFYPVVYINSNGEATVVEQLSRQTLQNISRIKFDDGTIHLMVESGHTTGTKRTIIFSFNDGKPIEELQISTIWCENSAFFGGFDYSTPSKMFFWNGKEYCMFEAVQPSKAISDMLCADKNILETIPDAEKEIADGNVNIIGGKYVSFKTQLKTFEFSDGGFQKYTPYISNGYEYSLTRSKDYWDFEDFEVPAYNVNPDK